MKKTTILNLFLCVVSVLAFTSCLDDDDNDDLSNAEIQQCFLATQGNHNGMMIYSSLNDSSIIVREQNDTAYVSWSITTDSTMILHRIPSKAIAAAFNNKELRDTLSTYPDQEINCGILYVNMDPIEWIIGPQTVTFNNVAFNGNRHRIQVVFYTDFVSSVGIYATTTRKIQMLVTIGGVYIDGQYSSDALRSTTSWTFLEQ